MNATARQKTDLLIVVCLLERKKQEISLFYKLFLFFFIHSFIHFFIFSILRSSSSLYFEGFEYSMFELTML
ncbi:hypothetical protein P8452_32244 [Trifolium repens]|nr:hypothetical protein P8452_32244 [Trifolium repens]